MDEELHALPPKYRDALILFYLDGQSSRQVAESLGITQGVADGRIKRGRQELRLRLARRGVCLGGAMTVAFLSAQKASAAVAPTLVQSTVQSALTKSAAGLCSPIAELAGTELMKTASILKPCLAVCAAAVLCGVSVFGVNVPKAEARSEVVPLETAWIRDSDSIVELPEDVPATVQQAQEEQEQVEAPGPRIVEVVDLKTLDASTVVETLQQVAPNARVTADGTRVLVLGTRGELEAIRKVAFAMSASMDPAKTRHAPLFIEAKMNQKGDRVALSGGSSGKLVPATSRILLPIKRSTVANGKYKSVTTMVPRISTRLVKPGENGGRRFFKVSELKVTRVSGTPVKPAELPRLVGKGEPIVVLSPGEKLSALYKKILRPSMVVITLPGPDEPKEGEEAPAEDRQASALDVLGIEVEQVSRNELAALGGKENGGFTGGLRICRVTKGSAAAAAGLENRDILVGVHVWETSKPEDLEFILRQQVTWRDGTRYYILRSGRMRFGTMQLASTGRKLQ